MSDELETIHKEVSAPGGAQENHRDWLGELMSWLESEVSTS